MERTGPESVKGIPLGIYQHKPEDRILARLTVKGSPLVTWVFKITGEMWEYIDTPSTKYWRNVMSVIVQ